jgi:hypothetical protein
MQLMKILYPLILFFGTLLISTTASSQNIQTATIQWSCTSTFVPQDGSFTDENTKVVSSPDQIVWYDSDNAVRETFAITGSVGAWSNTSANGSILFRVSSGDQVCTVQFEKSGGTTRIRISKGSGSDLVVYELTVNSQNTL